MSKIKPEHIKLLQKFIAEYCVFEDDGLISRRDFYNDYIDWLSQQSDVIETPSQVTVSEILSTFSNIRTKHIGSDSRHWVGITTKQKYVMKRIPVEIEKEVDNLIARFAQKPAPVQQSSQSKEQELLERLKQPYGGSKHWEPVGAPIEPTQLEIPEKPWIAKMEQATARSLKPAAPIKSDLTRLKEMLDKNQMVFITGRAGTGKTTLLREWIASKDDDRILLTATTGTAADNASSDGIRFRTIHSAFWIDGTKPIVDMEEVIEKLQNKVNNKRIKDLITQLSKYHTLVIEEISMARSDVMAAIDYTLQLAHKNTQPFGGVKVVLCGDMAQLPPVVNQDEMRDVLSALNHRYGGIYFFNNESIRRLQKAGRFGILELQIVRRQTDPTFIGILDRARLGEITRNDLEILNSAKNQSPHAVTLASMRKVVDKINEDRLNSLGTPLELIKGDIKRYDDPQELCFKYPNPPNPLRLKVGARVMILKNGEGYHNGSLGEYKGWRDPTNNLVITLDNGDTVDIEAAKQEEYRMQFDQKKNKVSQVVVADYTQFPVILAYALTVHRSQGKSFDHVEFRRGRSWNFGHGLIYTMLSRCRSLEGLNIVDSLNHSDFVCDRSIAQYIRA